MQNKFKYLKQIPKDPTGETKVIIMLHWLWSNSEDLFSLSFYFEDCYVFSLDGLFDLLFDSYAWYNLSVIDNKHIYDFNEVKRWYDYIVEFIKYLKNEYNLNSDNIYLFWFSQWAMMSYYLLWKSPELISGVIWLSGSLLKEINELEIKKESYKNKKIFIWHGKLDTIIWVEQVWDLQKYASRLWIEPEIRIYDNMPHAIIEEEISDIKKFLKNN